MTLDWSRIGTGAREPLLRPRDIYAALPNRPWPYLRQEQGEVLEKWFARKDDHDVVIKQNTGGGKTVAGLLIAQSTLNEDVGKAVYLAPDTYLVTRVQEEAWRLGLAHGWAIITTRGRGAGKVRGVTVIGCLRHGLCCFRFGRCGFRAGGWRPREGYVGIGLQGRVHHLKILRAIDGNAVLQ